MSTENPAPGALSPAAPQLTTTSDGPLGSRDAAAVRDLVRAAARADGVEPVSEQPLLRLSRPGPAVAHVLARARDGRRLLGYAQVDLGGRGAAATELVVHPEARRRGVGRALLVAARTRAALEGREVAVWAHGDLPVARAFGEADGLAVVRELLLLARPVPAAHDRNRPADASPGRGSGTPGPAVPPGVAVRSFVRGRDEERWLAVNARAFAHHPEQGRMSLADLDAVTSEDWFDPDGFLLAVATGDPSPGALLGFAWTKVPVGSDEGELYVLGVDPSAQGRGLGAALTALAVGHLASRGDVATVTLWTDADNTAAVRTYETAGFVRRRADVMLGPAPDVHPEVPR